MEGIDVHIKQDLVSHCIKFRKVGKTVMHVVEDVVSYVGFFYSDKLFLIRSICE